MNGYSILFIVFVLAYCVSSLHIAQKVVYEKIRYTHLWDFHICGSGLFTDSTLGLVLHSMVAVITTILLSFMVITLWIYQDSIIVSDARFFFTDFSMFVVEKWITILGLASYFFLVIGGVKKMASEIFFYADWWKTIKVYLLYTVPEVTGMPKVITIIICLALMLAIITALITTMPFFWVLLLLPNHKEDDLKKMSKN